MSSDTLNKGAQNCPDVTDANIGVAQLPHDNEALKPVYDAMHSEGPKAWFSDGENERKLILEMGEPWVGLVLEVGCGEGDLLQMIHDKGASTLGCDYSDIAVLNARSKHPELAIRNFNYHDIIKGSIDRLVLQGVLEHLDDPFTELKWMMDNLLAEKGDVITSSPCFLNPRGIVWMTLNMVGAVMSKTDLHYLHPWDFYKFSIKNNYNIDHKYCDESWGNGYDMMKDLYQRIPLALKDGNLEYDKKVFDDFMWFLSNSEINGVGATAVYRITK